MDQGHAWGDSLLHSDSSAAMERTSPPFLSASRQSPVAAYFAFGLPDSAFGGPKDRVDLVNKIATSLGLFIGGVWALFTFVLFRASVTDLQLTILPEVIDYRHNLRIVLINVSLKNVGKVVIRAGSAGCACSVWKLPTDLSAGGKLPHAHEACGARRYRSPD